MTNFTYTGPPFPELEVHNIKGLRFYETPSGEKYPSITTVIGKQPGKQKGLQEWRERVGEDEARKITTQASRRGTSVHNICEAYIKNEYGHLDGRMPNEVDLFSSIQPLLNRIDNIHVVEGSMWSDHLKLAGRTDLIGEFDNRLSVDTYNEAEVNKALEVLPKIA